MLVQSLIRHEALFQRQYLNRDLLVFQKIYILKKKELESVRKNIRFTILTTFAARHRYERKLCEVRALSKKNYYKRRPIKNFNFFPTLGGILQQQQYYQQQYYYYQYYSQYYYQQQYSSTTTSRNSQQYQLSYTISVSEFYY